MIEVRVLYGNLTVETAQITDMSSLRTSGVQGIVVRGSTETFTDRGGVLQLKDPTLLASSIGFDHYAVLYRGDSSGHWATIVSEDDSDFKWRPVEAHLSPTRTRTPIAALHQWFEGGLVSDAQFVKVQAKFRMMMRS